MLSKGVTFSGNVSEGVTFSRNVSEGIIIIAITAGLFELLKNTDR